MAVIASEDRRASVVPGMMSVADLLIVTEDSVSMISEAVMSGKKVMVLSLSPEGLSKKHRRFKEILERESAVVTASIEELENKILWLRNRQVPESGGP